MSETDYTEADLHERHPDRPGKRGTPPTPDGPPRCAKPTGVYDVLCAAPAGHEGGCVGPFYRAREIVMREAAQIVADCREQGLGLDAAERALLRTAGPDNPHHYPAHGSLAWIEGGEPDSLAPAPAGDSGGERG